MKLEASAPVIASKHRNVLDEIIRSLDSIEGGRIQPGTGYAHYRGGYLQIEEQLVTDASPSEELQLIIP